MTLTLTDGVDLVTTERYYHKEYTCETLKLYHLPFESYGRCYSFFLLCVCEKCDLHIWSCPWQMDLTLIFQKCLTTRNTHVKYDSFITYHSKVMANVVLFAHRRTKSLKDKQTNGHTDKQTNREDKNYPPSIDAVGVGIIIINACQPVYTISLEYIQFVKCFVCKRTIQSIARQNGFHEKHE